MECVAISNYFLARILCYLTEDSMEYVRTLET